MAHDSNQQSGRNGLDAPEGRDLFAAAVRDAATPVAIADARQPEQPLIFANDAFVALTGYPRAELLGRNSRLLQGPGTDAAEAARLAMAVAAGEPGQAELLNYRKDGSVFWNAVQLSPVRDVSGDLAFWFGSYADITQRKTLELEMRHAMEARATEVQAALTQKTALLHEVDHRVKNNLQLISSLLLLQSRRIEDPAARIAVRGMLDRVSAVATVHRRLFQNEQIARFDVAEFMRDLIADLVGSAGRSDLEVRMDLERIDVPSAQAAPLALVLNELLTNAIRHAYPPGQAGEVFTRLSRVGGGFEIEVADRGVGFDDPGNPQRGFGLTIVDLLSQQLRARTTFVDAQPGVRATVSTPLGLS